MISCPLCGFQGILLWQFHCSNPACRNFDPGGNASKEVRVSTFAPLVKQGDRVLMFDYSSWQAMDEHENEILNEHPHLYTDLYNVDGVYMARAGASFPGRIRENNNMLTVGKMFQGISPGRIFAVHEHHNDLKWTSVWVKEVLK